MIAQDRQDGLFGLVIPQWIQIKEDDTRELSWALFWVGGVLPWGSIGLYQCMNGTWKLFPKSSGGPR